MAISKRMRFLIFTRDGFTCMYCGRSASDVRLEVDHIYPRSRGGKDDIGNYLTACYDCNRGKGDTTVSPVSVLGALRKWAVHQQLGALTECEDEATVRAVEHAGLLDYYVEEFTPYWGPL